MPELAKWDSFYVILGSAAGTLIGLQFVVMTLLAQRPPKGGQDAAAAFATPTIVHFTTVLFLAAILRAPWPTTESIAVVWGLVGTCGFLYTVLVTWRMRRQSAYEPVWEDWLFHSLLPGLAYLLLLVFATGAITHPGLVLFGVAVSVLMLLFVGIHNAWDAVSYHVLVYLHKPEE
jgi:hypothetical protein